MASAGEHCQGSKSLHCWLTPACCIKLATDPLTDDAKPCKAAAVMGCCLQVAAWLLVQLHCMSHAVCGSEADQKQLFESTPFWTPLGPASSCPAECGGEAI